MKTKEAVNALLQKMDEVEALAKDIESKAADIERQKAASITNFGESKMSHPIIGADSDEKRAMRAFGVGSVQSLVKVNTGAPQFKHVPGELKFVVRELKKSLDVSRAISQIFHDRQFDSVTDDAKSDPIIASKSLLSTPYGKDVLNPRLKAFGSTVSGGGDEWVPTLIADSYIDEYELEHILESRFQKIPMRSNPFDLPKQTNVKTARKIAENTAITDTNFGTDKIRFTASKIGEYYILPEELNEDSAVDFLPIARDEVVMAQLRAVETAILNGDDDGTHIDSDTQAGAADLAEKLWKGLRRQGIANSANGGTQSFGGAAITKPNLRDMRAKMKKFGVLPTELAWICGPSVYQQFLSLDDVSTVDKFGSMATVLKGALAAYQGIPIIVSQHLRENLNATGVYDGVTTTMGGLLLVNFKRWMVGERRPIVVKAQYDLPSQDRYLLSSYQRKDFQGHAQSATEVSVVYGVNILV